MPTSRLWKPFTIPQKFLDSTWTSSSPILCLPTEVLILIFNRSSSLDQLSLALACKHLLQVSTFVNLKTSWFVGQKVTDLRQTVEVLLRSVRPLNKAGREKMAWHVCVDCLQYRPTRKSYWKKKKGQGKDSDGELEIREELWDGWVDSWNNRYLLQCPECVYDEIVVQRWKKYWSLQGKAS